MAVNGPSSEGYVEDQIDLWAGLTRAGTAYGGTDFTINSAYRCIAATGTVFIDLRLQ